MRLRKNKNRLHHAGLAMLPFVVTTLHASETEPPLSEEAFWGEVPVVMSATRMAQPVVDAPVAVTVIDREMIEASGAREIPELFRLVPGFMVGYEDGATPSVSYHMSPDQYARRMQVLVDGRSIYTTAFGGISWPTLNVTLDDIERIEVVRGPNSSSYGANSFLGVINIITRPAVLDRGSNVKMNVGSGGVRDVFIRHGGEAGKLDYRVSAGFISDDGFQNRNDYKRTEIASLRADYHATNDDLITVQAGVGRGPRGVENPWSPVTSPIREKVELEHHQQVRWERNLGMGDSVSVQFYHIYQHNFETYTINNYVLASTGPLNLVLDPLPIDFGRRTDRSNLEFQHNVTLGPSLRLAWGGGVRQDSVWGATNLLGNADIGNHLSQGFVNAEWEPARNWLVNAGAMVEDYSTTGTATSPRLGVNYKFSPADSVHFTVSRAVRNPSMFEYATNYAQDGTTSYVMNGVVVGPGPHVYNVSWLGTQQTRPEHIRSYELGYVGMNRGGRLSYDFKVYRDEITDLITQITHSVPGDNIDGTALVFENHDGVTIKGAEFESTLRFDADASARFAYAYTTIDNETPTSPNDYSHAAPENSANLLLINNFAQGYKGSLGYYFTGKMYGWESGDMRGSVRRLDLRLAKTTKLLNKETEVVLALRNVLGKYEEMDLLRPTSRFTYTNEVEPSAYLSVKIRLD